METSSLERGIKELLEEDGISHIPERYLPPLHQRPCFSPVCFDKQPPAIDLAALSGHNRSQIIEAISRACQDWGLFQVINHGVPRNCVDALWKSSQDFFQLPAKERMRWYSTNTPCQVAYEPTFGCSWADSLRFHWYGDENCSFDQAPECFRGSAVEFFKHMRELAMALCVALAEVLGADVELLEKAGARNLTYAKLHYYSPCPDPSLVLGKVIHTDPNFLTILMQDRTGGLQVFKDDSWVQVEPVEDAFLIFVGDQLQILSNGKLKSVEHRVVTNMDRARRSVACFMSPSPQARVRPLSELITPESPGLYREVAYEEYLRFFRLCASGKYALEQCRLRVQET